MEENFLTQLLSETTREKTPLDLFVNREGLVGDEMAGGCLVHSSHEMIEFLILGEVRRGVSGTATLDFRRADFGLFRGLVDRVHWEAVLRGTGVQESWILFMKEILKVQEEAERRAGGEAIQPGRTEIFVWNSKKIFVTSGRGGRQHRRTTRML